MTHRPSGAVPAYPRRCQNQRSTNPAWPCTRGWKQPSFGAERLAGDGAVADREILRQAGLPVPPH
jgi:hypothetical protein